MATPRVTIDELPEQTEFDDANYMVVQDAGVSKKMALTTLASMSPDALIAHIDDPTGAHAASAISATPTGVIVGTDVQAQLAALAAFAESPLTEDPPGSGLYYGTDMEGVFAGLPSGGSTGQVLGKESGDDYDTAWIDVEGGGGGGGTPDAHAASHGDGGSDEVTVAESQVTGLTAALAAKADDATTISTTAPLAGGGNLSTNRTLTVATFGTSAAGVVPASGGGTTNFLRADATWAAPPGGGGGISGITVAESGSALDTDITTLDFGTGFDLTESPENEVNIALDFTEVTIPQASVTNLVSDLAACATDTDLTTGLATKADVTRTINAQTGTTYTLVLGDAGDLVTLSNASAIALTVPLNSSVAYPTGTTIDLAQLGAGKVTVSGTGGVTVNAASSTRAFRAQYSAASLVKYGTDSWLLVGDLET